MTNSAIVSDRASTLQLFSSFQRPVMRGGGREGGEAGGGGGKIGLKTLGQDRGLYGSWQRQIWTAKVK